MSDKDKDVGLIKKLPEMMRANTEETTFKPDVTKILRFKGLEGKGVSIHDPNAERPVMSGGVGVSGIIGPEYYVDEVDFENEVIRGSRSKGDPNSRQMVVSMKDVAAITRGYMGERIIRLKRKKHGDEHN